MEIPPVPTAVPVVVPAVDTGGTVGVVTEAGLGEVSLGSVVSAATAAVSVGLGTDAGVGDPSVGSGSGGVGVAPLGGLPEELVPLLELGPAIANFVELKCFKNKGKYMFGDFSGIVLFEGVCLELT